MVDVGKPVMYIIAGTIAVCLVLVILAKGIDALPFGIFGLIGGLVFLVAALAMTRFAPDHSKH